MLISEISHKDEVISLIIKELNQLNIKVPREKFKFQNLVPKNKKRKSKKILQAPIEDLELDQALMSNGSIGEIPKFVSACCKRLTHDLEVEGIFRKNGSVKKQKFILEHIEKTGIVDKSHNPIDVANLLKTFFRDLPSPLIPHHIQDPMLRCLSNFKDHEMKCEAILLLLLLLPPIAINTLAYFLQFLKTVIKYSSKNLMTCENLVKVLTPTLMPLNTNLPPQRLNSHFAVVELLIEKANFIGVLPERLIPMRSKTSLDGHKPANIEPKSSHKRRSINRAFNGLRKIVTNIANSSEELDKSNENILDTKEKSTKSSKRRQSDIVIISSSKKKKEQVGTSQFYDDVEMETKPAGNVQIQPDYIRVPKREYEAFKDRLTSIETKISNEFNLTKLEQIKIDNTPLKVSNVNKVEDKFNQTLHELEKLEKDDKNADFLARKISRDLKIRKSIDLHRSPSARKIGTLKRRRNDQVTLTRNRSWHLGQKEAVPKPFDVKHPKPKPQNDKKLSETVKIIENVQFINVPSNNTMNITVTNETSLKKIEEKIEPKVEKKAPEKPVRMKRPNIEIGSPAKQPKTSSAMSKETWTPADEFFKSPSTQPDALFKTPIMGRKKLVPRYPSTDVKVNKFQSARLTSTTPLRNFQANNKVLINQSPFLTPVTEPQCRESIIVLRSRLNGMVKSKIAALESNDITTKIATPQPTKIINKNLEHVKSLMM